MVSLMDWRGFIDLSPNKKEILSLAKKRESQKKRYRTSRQWSKEPTNLTGLKGEFAFSLCTGLPVDKQLKKFGDSGVDFSFEGITYDIKSTTYTGHDPMLLEMPDKKLVSHIYVCFQVSDWTARIVGWASRKQMRHAFVRNLGYGERLCYKESELKELKQNTIPPHVPSVDTEPRIAAQRSALQLSNTKVILTLSKL